MSTPDEDLLQAARAALNVLSLLTPEIKRLGFRADRVPGQLHAAIARVMGGPVSPCPSCGLQPSIARTSGAWVVTCPGCYDGAPDAGRHRAIGASERDVAAAVTQWNDEAERIAEVRT